MAKEAMKKRSWAKKRCNVITPFPHQAGSNKPGEDSQITCVCKLPGFWLAIAGGLIIYSFLF